MALVGVDQNLARPAEHALHHVQIQTFLGDILRLAIFGQQLIEARSITLGLGHDLFAIAGGFGDLSRRCTARARQASIGVGLGFVLDPRLLLARLDRVGKRGLPRFRWLGLLHAIGRASWWARGWQHVSNSEGAVSSNK